MAGGYAATGSCVGRAVPTFEFVISESVLAVKRVLHLFHICSLPA
jgi:hypothetical protein